MLGLDAMGISQGRAGIVRFQIYTSIAANMAAQYLKPTNYVNIPE